MHRDCFLTTAYPGKLVDEVHMPVRAPKLALGRNLETCLVLELGCSSDRIVLYLTQTRSVNLTGCEARPSFK